MSDPDSNVITTSKQTNVTDDVDSEMDDDQFVDHIPDENGTQHNPSLSNAIGCLTYSMGSLKDSCEAAFCPPAISDRHPVLVYIHPDRNSFRADLCKKSLCSQTIIDYLNANYVVWQCDFKSNSDRFRFFEDWQKMFPNEFFDDFPTEEYPLLIGVMRLFEYNIDGIITSGYQFRTLVKDDILMRTRLTVNHENLLAELNIFKTRCHENEKNPIFSFVEKSRLSWEVIVEIAEYLSLNDAINAFSIDIFALLDHPQAKVHLLNPSDSFIKQILPKIKNKQSISLEFTRDRWSRSKLHLLPPSKELISIIFHELDQLYLSKDYLRYYPNLTRLCLYYDCETNYTKLTHILYEFQHQLKRLEIHCPGLYVDYCDLNPPKNIEKKMMMVEYFLLDISLRSSSPMYDFLETSQGHYFMAGMTLMKTMPNIRYLHLIFKNDDIERVFYVTIWELIVRIFSKLKKIRIDVCETKSENKESLTKRASELQTVIRARQEAFKFKIRFL